MYCSIDKIDLEARVNGRAIAVQTDHRTRLEMEAEPELSVLFAMVEVLFFAAIVALKGKYWTALVSVFIPLVGWVSAFRLAKPSSPWASRRYAEGSEKLAKATARAERSSRRYRRWQDLIGGRPTAAGSSDEI